MGRSCRFGERVLRPAGAGEAPHAMNDLADLRRSAKPWCRRDEILTDRVISPRLASARGTIPEQMPV
jgi:hypothetical protein